MIIPWFVRVFAVCSSDMLIWHIVAEASGGQQALDCVKQNAPDLLLLDLRMPDMNGPEVTRKALRIQPNLKIL
jgi:CheY-like chemotaxis protein